MGEPLLARVIPLLDHRQFVERQSAHSFAEPLVTGEVRDRLQRPLRDLRISVTDRCNFRCAYCMPKEVFGSDYQYLPHSSLLSFEEITRVARQFVALGVRKIRLTGGEPLLRKNLEELLVQLTTLNTPDGDAIDLTMTTNGSLLARKAVALKAAGLNRVTVSLDALDDRVFKRMNDVDFPVAKVLDGIEAAQAAGITNIKVNMVVQRGVNDQQIMPMARFFQGSGVALRFIEFMDVGSTNGWNMDAVLPSEAVIRTISEHMPLVRLQASAAGETAQRWGYAGPNGQHQPSLGEIGVISSVTQAFCGDCNRARLSTEGRLFTCLFAGQGFDLRHILRGTTTAEDEQLTRVINSVWRGRADRYSQMRSSVRQQNNSTHQRRPEMSYIGG
ncbi:GTP 3',8-cyclase MoaA [Hydrogenophaga pseudoflava]|nr:GTP 3',8-cyclase MoaA [Hydrogenophaga pseudoflava]MDQ7746380.1 GTP 3',8-cyclase MoaA [Hydrogenophaga pseudoflava]